MSKTYEHYRNNVADVWYKDPSLRINMACAVVSYFGSFSIGYDGAYLNGLQSMTTWKEFFDHPAGNRLGLISAMAYIPALVLMPLYGICNDRLGRRWSNQIGALFVIAGGLVGALATGDPMLLAGRALMGIGGSALVISSNLLCNELLHPRLRSVGAAFFLCFYYVGAIVAAWTSYIVIRLGWDSSWSWRLPTILQVFGPAIVMAGTFFMPESPRWLIAQGKKDQAHRVLANQHANGKMDDELVLWEMDQIEAALEREKIEKMGFMTFFKTPGNRRRLLILAATATGTQGNGVAVFSYYLTPVLKLVGVTDPAQQTGINGGMQIWNLVLACAGASLVERMGRRKLWLISTCGMLLSYICLTGLAGAFATGRSESVGLASVAFMFFCYGFYDIAWTPLAYSYSLEILPYSMRANGMAFFVWMQKTTLCVNQWVNPIALQKAAWKYYFIFMGALIVYVLVIFFYFPETRGLSLEEVTQLFDAKDGRDLSQERELADSQAELGKKQDIMHVENVDDKASL
ncbi:hypothetical protein JCM8547_001763 [Rhodosporidiobolus lusitaniae]